MKTRFPGILGAVKFVLRLKNPA